MSMGLIDCVETNVQVTGSHVVFGDERLLEVDDLVGTQIRVEVRLKGVKSYYGSISTTTPEIRKLVSSQTGGGRKAWTRHTRMHR